MARAGEARSAVLGANSNLAEGMATTLPRARAGEARSAVLGANNKPSGGNAILHFRS